MQHLEEKLWDHTFRDSHHKEIISQSGLFWGFLGALGSRYFGKGKLIVCKKESTPKELENHIILPCALSTC